MEAILLQSFVRNVEQGHIVADESYGAGFTLGEVVAAFKRIRDGENAEAALGIKRTKGVSPTHPALVLYLYHLREVEGVLWKNVPDRANEWLKHQGFGPLKERQMHDIYPGKKNDMKPAVEMVLATLAKSAGN